MTSDDDGGSYDQRLIMFIGTAGLVLFVFFAMTPVLRPYYALLMPAVIALGAGLSLALLPVTGRTSLVSSPRSAVPSGVTGAGTLATIAVEDESPVVVQSRSE